MSESHISALFFPKKCSINKKLYFVYSSLIINNIEVYNRQRERIINSINNWRNDKSLSINRVIIVLIC